MSSWPTEKRSSNAAAAINRPASALDKDARSYAAPQAPGAAHHGTWTYQVELPPNQDGSRRGPLRRGGFTAQDDARNEMENAQELLAIAEGDQETAILIAEVITQAVKDTKRLPDAEVIRRRVRTGQDLSSHMVQQTLGLSSITIAADTYTSVLPDLARRAAEDVAKLINPPRRRTPDDTSHLQLLTGTRQ